MYNSLLGDYFSYNQKKEIVKECLKHFSTAIFLDSAVRIFGLDDLNFLKEIESGLHIFNVFGSIADSFLNEDICISDGKPRSRNTKYGKEGLDFLIKNNLKYTRNYHGIGYPEGPLEHFLEGKWIIKKDEGRENVFFDIWDKLSYFVEQKDLLLGYNNTAGAGEGALMSISSFNSNIKTHTSRNHLSNIFNTNFISNYQRKVLGEIPWSMFG